MTQHTRKDECLSWKKIPIPLMGCQIKFNNQRSVLQSVDSELPLSGRLSPQKLSKLPLWRAGDYPDSITDISSRRLFEENGCYEIADR